ncbi:hypothetical protein [Bradyrhizobium monzae]|uniref:hypothetical protein n=1 Tax=Bradyrhizobium sp. Oc8 TaxID=2876780 RepID=UPI001F3FDA70|nr:hypothetical protein [Bradyrhizobium sp. Oc8]
MPSQRLRSSGGKPGKALTTADLLIRAGSYRLCVSETCGCRITFDAVRESGCRSHNRTAWISKARKTHLQSEKALRHAEEQQVERLRYQAALAERQFNRADPDNRLVAGELERRWEAALLELRRAEEASAQRKMPQANEPLGVPHDVRANVIALGNRLPALWDNQATRRDHRKALLRCLIEKVVMRRCARDKAEVRIVWRGGATTPASAHYQLMPWLPCRGTKKWWSAYAR